MQGLLGEVRFSSLYRTAPQLDLDQEPFWNAAAAGTWPGSLEGLLERLLMWESGAGRQRDASRPKGPRLIDLDLLFDSDQVIVSERLTIPHSGLSQRRFALEPLVELLPLSRSPETGEFWTDRLRLLPDQGVDRTDRTW